MARADPMPAPLMRTDPDTAASRISAIPGPENSEMDASGPDDWEMEGWEMEGWEMEGWGTGSGKRPIRIVTFSTLYPNAAQPTHGVFVENRLRQLVASGEVVARVVAPVPWFPLAGKAFGRYGRLARVPARETRHGIDVVHPRYPLAPKVGMSAAPLSLFAFMRPVLARLVRDGGDFDLLDAHYFFPDGVAAVMLARALSKPVTITARGTDINLIPRYRLPRRMIRRAAGRADGLITVCGALKDELSRLGVPAERVRTLRNGVDLETFRPLDPVRARTALGLGPDVGGVGVGGAGRPVLASVGGLIERKGHHLVIAALEHLPGATLLIAGEGPEKAALARLANRLGVEGRVRFLGSVPHERLREVYGAADALVLASSREGWANVLLEAMACGTPVIASRVWGAPEVVRAPEAGLLLESRTPEAIADAVRALCAAPPARAATRAYAEGFGWETTTRGQLELFSQILSSRTPGSSSPAVTASGQVR